MKIKSFFIILLLSTGCADLCNNSIISQVPSPDNKYKIIIFTRDCGATTDFSTQVSLLPYKELLKNITGNIFVADSNHGKAETWKHGGPKVSASWNTNNEIVLTISINARISKAIKTIRDIKISYKYFEAIGDGL
jgi:hypothetical protein